MATISLTLPSDGQTIDASDVNNPFNTIAAEINGNLDNSNIKAGAAIERSKIAGFTDGWESLGYAPTTITALGNRSYTVLVPSVDTTSATSPGQRLKLPRTVTAPTQCTDLESGSSQYYSKTSPAGMTFTDDFTASAWVKLESYTGSNMAVISRYNGTNGYILSIGSAGQITLGGYGAGVNRVVTSYQSVPLNKWVHIAATIDLSGSLGTVYIDGVLVPSLVTSAGAGLAAITQAGNFEIGSYNGGTNLFDGKIAQVALYSAVLSAATIRASMNQTLTGSETSLISAYTFNNSLNDLSANANNLTANGSAVATNADTPFTNPVTGTSVTAGTTNYGIIMAQTFSTNTTYTVQIPEGETLPTTGGIGTISYSTQKTPYGFPGQRGKWQLEYLLRTLLSQATPTSGTWYNPGTANLSVPVGDWNLHYMAALQVSGTNLYRWTAACLSTTASSISGANDTHTIGGAATNIDVGGTATCLPVHRSVTTQTPYYLNILEEGAGATFVYFLGDRATIRIAAENAYL